MTTETANKAVSANKLISAYKQIDAKRSELKRAFEKEDSHFKEVQQLIKVRLLAIMDEIETSQLKGDDAIAYKQIAKKFSSSDWNSVWNYVKETGRFDILQKRLSDSTVAEILEETGELPPGINLFQEYQVVIRKS